MAYDSKQGYISVIKIWIPTNSLKDKIYLLLEVMRLAVSYVRADKVTFFSLKQYGF